MTRVPMGRTAALGTVLALAAGVCLPAGAQSADAPARAASPSASPAEPVPLGSLLERARTEIARGDAATTFHRLSRQVQWYGGTPEFDYLLGLAAIDAGRPAQAVLALERVLAVEPGHLQARAELGRALLAIREREAARREFEAVAAQRIPPEVRRIIDGYLERIAAGDPGVPSQLQGYVEAGIGWDGNVNLGSLSGQWLLGSGVAVIPEASSRPRESATMSFGAGLSWRRPIGGGWGLMAGTQLAIRSNASAHTLDQVLLEGSGGAEYRTACHTFTMLGQLQQLRVDDTAFRNATGAVAQWRCELDSNTQVGAYVQSFDMRFPDQVIRDARREVFGATFARAIDAPGAPVIVASAYAGRERPRADVPQLRYRLRGVRAVISATLGDRIRGFAGLSWESRDFAGEEPLFDTTRSDRQTDLRAGVDMPIGRAWVLTPQVAHTRNSSTLAPNEFRRTQVEVTARHRF